MHISIMEGRAGGPSRAARTHTHMCKRMCAHTHTKLIFVPPGAAVGMPGQGLSPACPKGSEQGLAAPGVALAAWGWFGINS